MYEGWVKNCEPHMWIFDFFFQSIHFCQRCWSPVLKSLNATFKHVLFLTVQKTLHCMYDIINWLKRGTRNGCFNFRNKWKSDGGRWGDLGRRGWVESIQSHNYRWKHSNDRRVCWSIVVVKQYTFTEFPTALDLNIFSWLPKKWSIFSIDCLSLWR